MVPSDEPVEIPIEGTLDLHQFNPRDIKKLVPDYLEECRKKGIYNVRIIHGKGKGVQRRIVRAILDRLDWVSHYQTADLDSGGWGAILVTLETDISDE